MKLEGEIVRLLIIKGEPREFGRLLQDIVGIEAIINRVVVHDDYDTQMRWLHETNKDFEIENMIIVGGESSKVNYPGPTVNEALNAISNIYNQEAGDIFCGGIAIQAGLRNQKIS